jgi:hypothetical protein
VIKGLISGMTAEDIRRHYDMTAAEYDTTRRRIRPDDTASRFGLVVAMTRTAYPQSRLTALLDALERELLAAPADEVRDAWREAGRAGNIACQEVRELLNEAIATSEDSSAATPWRDTSAETGLDQLFWRFEGASSCASRSSPQRSSGLEAPPALAGESRFYKSGQTAVGRTVRWIAATATTGFGALPTLLL